MSKALIKKTGAAYATPGSVITKWFFCIIKNSKLIPIVCVINKLGVVKLKYTLKKG
jgi:hypothetical protein